MSEITRNAPVSASEGGTLEEQLADLCAWAAETRGAVGVLEAVAAAMHADEALPSGVEAALIRLGEFRAPATTKERYSLAAAFEELEADQSQAFEVFRLRHLSGGKPPTLQELGETLGVTRERVRQLENRVKSSLRRRIEEDRDWPLRTATERLRGLFGPLARVDELTTVQRFVDPTGDALNGHPHRMILLLMLAGDYRVQESWIVAREIEARTMEVLCELTDSGPVSIEVAFERLGALGVREELRIPWIEAHRSFRVIGDQIVFWGRSMADKAAAVLAVAGVPLEPEDLFARIAEDRNFRGFKQQVQGDDRFRRRGLRLYGLTAWGGEEYTTIVDEMTEELERRGGSLDLQELAETLAANFGVSASSVRMYADGPQFEVDQQGRVSRRSGDLPMPASSPLAMTRCCFRLAGGWAYRRTVDRDVLRGSGGGLPIPFAKEIGLKPGRSMRFDSPLGEVGCSWPAHMAHIGSLRPAAEELGAVEGDRLFIVHVASGRFDIRLVERTACESARGFERLGLECGRVEAVDAQNAIAESVGLDPTQPNLGTAIRLRLEERGERELASLVPRGTAGDDVLDVLASLGE